MAPEAAEGRVLTLPCARFFARTVTTDGEVTQNVVVTVRNDTTIEADEFRSLFYVRDAHMTLSINDWVGEAVYGGQSGGGSSDSRITCSGPEHK